MCSFCNSKKNTHNCHTNFRTTSNNRRTPRMKRYLENDLSAYSSENNNSCNCCCNCCCCGYENEAQYTAPYCDYNTAPNKTYTPETYCDTGYSEYKNDKCY